MYINGTACVTAQDTSDFESFCANFTEKEDFFLKAEKQNYKDILKPAEARRMSKTVKNGILCSLKAIEESRAEKIDAIIAGTGLGIVSDTEKFLGALTDNDEKFLTPTAFIQSTHNTVAAQVANYLKNNEYNFTYVHRAFSFESALLDSLMHLKEGKENILAGGTDEMTEEFYKIYSKTGLWNTAQVKNTGLLNFKTEGAILGEGSAFFVLSSQKNEKTYAEILDLEFSYKPNDYEENIKNIKNFMSRNDMNISDIDLVIFGDSGDINQSKVFTEFRKGIFTEVIQTFYKHICGEYHTSSAVALWLAANITKTQNVPEFTRINKVKKQIKTVLIFNRYLDINQSLILLQKT